MKCPEPSIKEPCYFCYNGECFATHWWECAKGFRKPHEGKKGNKNNRYYRERYKRIAQSEEFKKTYEGMSVGEIMHVEREEPVGNDFEMALAEMIDKAQTSVVEPLVVAALWKDELIKLAKSEEPVSEDLEDAAFDYAEACKYEGGEKLLCIEHFKAGAKWQKEQFEKNRLKHCNSITNEQAELEQGFIDQHLDKHQRMPTFLDAIEYGMRLQKEQIEEALLSEVLPCFMHGGEADEVAAKLEEVLDKKK